MWLHENPKSGTFNCRDGLWRFSAACGGEGRMGTEGGVCRCEGDVGFSPDRPGSSWGRMTSSVERVGCCELTQREAQCYCVALWVSADVSMEILYSIEEAVKSLVVFPSRSSSLTSLSISISWSPGCIPCSSISKSSPRKSKRKKNHNYLIVTLLLLEKELLDSQRTFWKVTCLGHEDVNRIWVLINQLHALELAFSRMRRKIRCRWKPAKKVKSVCTAFDSVPLREGWR